jgi:hypothetical protein
MRRGIGKGEILRGDADIVAAPMRYPPQDNRRPSLSRALDYGRDFTGYVRRHNEKRFGRFTNEHRKTRVLAAFGAQRESA